MSKAWHAHVPGIPKQNLVLAGETITVRFEASKATANALPNTGLVQLKMDARMSTPSVLPSTIHAGVTTVTTIAGIQYFLRLVGSIDTRHHAAVAATGEAIRFMAIEWTDWTVNRAITSGQNPDTGAPVTTRADLTNPVGAHFIWAASQDQPDYQADTEAVLVTLPNTMQAGDRITNTTFGTFIVLEASPKPHGPFDRVEVRQA